MDCTIARTAARLATFRSPTLVSTEPKSVCLQIDADPRFAAGAGGVAKFFAENAGLEGEAPQQLQGAVVNACLEAFDSLNAGHPHLMITFTRHPDRIEVSIAHEGDSARVRADRTGSSLAAEGAPPPALALPGRAPTAAWLGGVARIQSEPKATRAVPRLTKYTSQPAPSR